MVLVKYMGSIEQKEQLLGILANNQSSDLPPSLQNITKISDIDKLISELGKETSLVIAKVDENAVGVGIIYVNQATANIGYIISNSQQQKGYGGLIVNLIIAQLSLEQIKMINAGVMTNNMASIKILESNGFTLQKIEKQCRYYSLKI